MSAPGTPGGVTRDPGAGEHDENTEFLLESLRDLEDERAAGDIGDDDYRTLRDEYTVRAAAALRAEQRGQAPPVDPSSKRPWSQRLAVIAGVVGFAVLAGVLVAQASGRRDAGEGITGEVARTPTQEAARCLNLTVTDDLVEAVECYRDVLDEDPDNAVAHTYLGWTLYLTARRAGDELPPDTLVDLYVTARRQLDAAVESDPRYADARAFQVVLAVREGRFEDAAEHLAVFDDLDAPADMRALVDGTRTEIAEGLASPSSSTTAPPQSGSSPTPPSTGGG